MFTAHLFIINKHVQQPKCPSKWTNIYRNTHMIEFCVAIGKNEVSLHATVSKSKSQKHKVKWKKQDAKRQIPMTLLYEISRIGKFIETENTPRDRERGLRNDYFQGTVCSSEVMKKLWNLKQVLFEQHYECIKCHWIGSLLVYYVDFTSINIKRKKIIEPTT